MSQGNAPAQSPLHWNLMAAGAATATIGGDSRASAGTWLAATDKVVAQATVSTPLARGRVMWSATVGMWQVGSSLAQAACRLEVAGSPVSQEYFVDFQHSSDDQPLALTAVSDYSAATVTATVVCRSTNGTVALGGVDLAGIAGA